MQVKLISLTQIVDVPEVTTPEELIVYIARVSNPSNQGNMTTAPKLIRYLVDHEHWSPFEMVDITFEVETSRAISAQLIRHRSFSFQEFSTRYSPVLGIEPIELRRQAETNRQSSTTTITNFDYLVKNVITQSVNLYQKLLDEGVAKETARMILPMATQTKLYMKGSLRSWIHFLDVRDDEHAQKEAQLIAKEIKKELIVLFPNVATALGWKNEN